MFANGGGSSGGGPGMTDVCGWLVLRVVFQAEGRESMPALTA